MNLSEFLAKTTDLDEFETLFPNASGVRSTWWGTAPVYATAEDWEADFSESCRPPSTEQLTEPYAIHVRQG